jgi:hypothetical protein
MGKNSSSQTSTSPDAAEFERLEGALAKNHYFDNERVERLLCAYLESACTDVNLRDQVMQQTEELIRQIIKAHNLSQIYPGREESSFYDLFQTAWIQIESALYKYEARPHCAKCYNRQRPNDSILSQDFIFPDEIAATIGKCPKCSIKLERSNIYYKGKSKVFNLWSQIARTVILAYIKKENRDRKNSPVFQTHLESRTPTRSHVLERFFSEAREIFKDNNDFMKLLDTMEQLYREDEKPTDGFIAKLVAKSDLPRSTVTMFLKMLRLRSHDFTDSPINETQELKRRREADDSEDEY